MGLPRPPGDFDRIYSPPEPPETARRSRRVSLMLGVGAVGVAVVAVFLLVPWGDDGARTPPGGARPSGEAVSSPSVTGARGPVYSVLPPACASVSAETVRRLVPGAKRTSSGNDSLAYCGFGVTSGSAEARDRYLAIDSRLYPPGGAVTPIERARRHFDVEWTLAGRATEERTVTLERRSGLGEQAYDWFKVDEARSLAIGVVAVRTRNVIITVSYSERTAGENPPPAQRQRCLREAAGVVREVLGRLR